MQRLTGPEAPQHGATVRVTVSKNKKQQENLDIALHKVSQHCVIYLELVAERVEVRPGLVGLAAKAVAAEVAGREQVAALGLPLTLAEEVGRLLGAVGLAGRGASRDRTPHRVAAS